ncbi:ATP-dependent RNA helicase mrh4 [Penicillium waksmanii]|uniref:ATP-dependent RNA helicase mrh4 n=1 Tax=Penicillium waksmanii TaxID=69791 RepID=UPI00254986ED|nr:ATP-dependent RNA helicase mrh4 [Penicillium waksmanii]KAJ5988444.1 ATP-dependent RNA helicase mrh4 [Penicillium waksmanii]
MPLPIRSSICFLCQTRTVLPPASTLLPSWQATRSMASARSERKPSRMSLSPNVARSSINKPRSGRGRAGPFNAMNQTEARIRDDPRPRSQASLKRSKTEGKDEKRKEAPLYKALKMQTTLAPVTYGRRTAIKSKISNLTSFDHFPLLPVVRHSIFSQGLPGLADVSPTPIQRVAIPQLLAAIPKHQQKQLGPDDPQYEQFLLAAETGSGKTLAYLLPVLDAIKRAEARDLEEEKILAEEKAKEREERLKNRTYELEPEEPPHDGLRPA